MNSVVVYSCLWGEDDKRKHLNRFQHGLYDSGPQYPLNSGELLSEITNSNLNEVNFTVYPKNGTIESDYEILILLDTCTFCSIESTSHKTENLDDDENDVKNILREQKTYIDQFNELVLPFQRSIHIEFNDDSEINSTSTLSSLRTRCLLIPIKLANHWTLLWVKFSKFTKYVEVFQLSSLAFPGDKLSFKSLQTIKYLVSNLIGLENYEDLVVSYQYVFRNVKNIEGNKDSIIVHNIQSIVKGYQEYGFNVSVSNLPELLVEEMSSNHITTRKRALPLLSLKEIKEINDKYIKRRQTLPIQPNVGKVMEVKKRNTQSQSYTNVNLSINAMGVNGVTNNSKATNNVENNENRAMRKRPKTIEAPKLKPKLDGSVDQPLQSNPNLIVTLENLETIKKTIDYDEKKMLELVKLYTSTYDQIEEFLLDKWSRVNLFPKDRFPESGPPFLIYGPSQIELEILKAGGIIATNSLKEKIKKYNLTLTTKTMRYLTSSRRWINQRFKLNKKINNVFYTRDGNLIIPDYRDIPYIVIATHLAYGCLGPDETFNIIHHNWYISRKMVLFLVSNCYKCKDRPKN